jgi:hypothetical protein
LLLKSCIEHGFFYLDFHDDETLEIKMRDFRAGGPYGYVQSQISYIL